MVLTIYPWLLAVLFVSCLAERVRIEPNRKMLKTGEFAVVINFPRNIIEQQKDWRERAHESNLVHDSSDRYLHLSRAQDKEDILLYENWFFGKSEGLLIESGAFQGVALALGYMFEKYASWKAINVEPDPTTYRILKNNRPDAINVFSALCAEPMTLHYTDAMGQGGEVRGFVEFMPPDFLKRFHPDIYNNKTSLNDLAKMRCLTMKDLLRSLAVTHVDLWVLDVEGAEEEILKGVDFDAVQFDVIAMECDGFDKAKDQRKIDMLQSNSFSCYQVERNCMCKHKSFQPSTRKDLTPLNGKMHWTGTTWTH